MQRTVQPAATHHALEGVVVLEAPVDGHARAPAGALAGAGAQIQRARRSDRLVRLCAEAATTRHRKLRDEDTRTHTKQAQARRKTTAQSTPQRKAEREAQRAAFTEGKTLAAK